MSWIINIIVFIALYYNVKKKRFNFILLGITNLYWIGFNIYYELYSQVFVWSIYLLFSIYGYSQWNDQKLTKHN